MNEKINFIICDKEGSVNERLCFYLVGVCFVWRR